MAFVCVALVGVAIIPLLPVKLNPSRTLPGFTVRFSMPGTSARVVEMTATSKLEAMLARVKGIRGISSTSGNGWGSVSVNLDKHVDAAVARFEASTIIRQTWPELPDGVSYPYIQMHSPGQSSQGPFYGIYDQCARYSYLNSAICGGTYKNTSCTDSGNL